MSKPKILIIGAGIAGLAAANKLSGKYFDVTVLEARNRIGGRIFTDNSFGIPLDLGASWIHGLANNPITKLANEFGAQYFHFISSNKLIFDRHHQIVSSETITNFLDQMHFILQSASAFAKNSKKDISLLDAINKVESFSDKHSELQSWFFAFLCNWCGVEINRVSSKYFFQEGIGSDNHFITNGYSKIVNGLAVGQDVQLNTVVDKIDYHQTKIILSTNHGNLHADNVIITLPLGVLKNNSVQFTPALPSAKKEAIEKLSMGILNKIILKFLKPFWPSEFNGIYITPTAEPAISLYVSNYHYLNEPILTGILGGQAAYDLENLSDVALVNLMMENIYKAFGHNIPSPEKFLITRWAHDPYSGGSYSSVSMGASIADINALAAPLNNQVFFAGEATSSQFSATTQGAYMSGIKAADDIIFLYDR